MPSTPAGATCVRRAVPSPRPRRPHPRPEARSLGVLIRALLSAISLIVLIPVGFAVVGGFLPNVFTNTGEMGGLQVNGVALPHAPVL